MKNVSFSWMKFFFLSSVKRCRLKSGTSSAVYSRCRPILIILVTNHWFFKGEFVSIVAKYFQSLFDISDVNEAQWHQGFNVRGWIDMLYKAPIFLEGRSRNAMEGPTDKWTFRRMVPKRQSSSNTDWQRGRISVRPMLFLSTTSFSLSKQ